MTSIPTGSQAGDAHPDGVITEQGSPLTAVNFVLRHVRQLFVIPMGIALFVGALNFLFANQTWSAVTMFMPQSDKKNPGASIAADFGVDVGGDDKQNSPMFYVALIKSRALQSALVLNKYVVVDGKDTLRDNLIGLYKIKGKTPALQRENAIKMMAKDAVATADIRTGIVTITVRARWASLARDMADKLLADVNDFNLNIRKSKGRAEFEFVRAQVAEARAELRQSEYELQSFMTRNREYLAFPPLVTEHERIVRELQMRTLRYSTLTMKEDQAELDAIRSTAVITVIQRAELPARPLGRGTVLRTLVTFILTSILSGIIVLIRLYARRRKESGADDYQEFQTLSRTLWTRVRSFGRKPRTAV